MTLPGGLEAVKEADPSYEFVHSFWHELSLSEAKNRRPWLNVEDLESSGVKFYRCDMFNEASRECMAYNQRPRVCSGFPWYGKEPSIFRLVGLPRCSFWEEIPEDVRPQELPVKFVKKPAYSSVNPYRA